MPCGKWSISNRGATHCCIWEELSISNGGAAQYSNEVKTENVSRIDSGVSSIDDGLHRARPLWSLVVDGSLCLLENCQFQIERLLIAAFGRSCELQMEAQPNAAMRTMTENVSRIETVVIGTGSF